MDSNSMPINSDRDELDVFAICTAYESGFGHGIEKRTDVSNPYRKDTNEFEAYDHGYELGESRSNINTTNTTPTDVLDIHTKRIAELECNLSECSEYLKENETVAQCLARNRKDLSDTVGELAECMQRAEKAEARLKKLANFNPDWDMVEALQDDIKEFRKIGIEQRDKLDAVRKACIPIDRLPPSKIVNTKTILKIIGEKEND